MGGFVLGFEYVPFVLGLGFDLFSPFAIGVICFFGIFPIFPPLFWLVFFLAGCDCSGGGGGVASFLGRLGGRGAGKL